VGARFSAPVQTGPGANPASCTMGTGSFPGVKRPGRGVDHPPQSSAEGKERVELYSTLPLLPLWAFMACSRVNFTFTITIYILLYEPEFSTMTPLMALASRVSLYDLINLNFSVFREVYLKWRKFCQPYDNFGEKR
jgi:hypothetical protein